MRCTLKFITWLRLRQWGLLAWRRFFFFLPFLNSGVLSGAPRNAIIVLVAMGVWPHELSEAPPFLSVAMIPLVLQEAAVGVMLGCLLSWPFWVMHALGCIIDNQRGQR
ncbi:virulence associated secretory protein [Salmonella enterica subsp. arizonae]|uniref:Virulence associated secretory protein n=1 Tax=Salmonella enterica subsp. arizonae TaxID=59203 RepID=A0A2X4TNI2_SALER|nr:virulence associated secretory protein [Salmonella enterica subsp. arizonae]